MFANITMLAAEEGATNKFWLVYDANEIYWGGLAAVIVAFLLWKFGRKPIAAYFNGRVEKVSTSLDAAAQLRSSAEAERDRIKAALADSENEAAKLIEQARLSADQLEIDIAARTEADIAIARKRAANDQAATRAQAESDLAGELSRLSLGAAERVVESSLDDAAQQRLIDDYISQVGSQN